MAFSDRLQPYPRPPTSNGTGFWPPTSPGLKRDRNGGLTSFPVYNFKAINSLKLFNIVGNQNRFVSNSYGSYHQIVWPYHGSLSRQPGSQVSINSCRSISERKRRKAFEQIIDDRQVFLFPGALVSAKIQFSLDHRAKPVITRIRNNKAVFYRSGPRIEQLDPNICIWHEDHSRGTLVSNSPCSGLVRISAFHAPRNS